MNINETILMLEDGHPYLEYKDTGMYVGEKSVFNSSDKFFDICRDMQLEKLGQERVYAFWLNSASNLLSMTMLSQGSIDRSLFSEREMCQIALLTGAVNAVAVHNHPSGDPAPSDIDIITTKKIKNALEMVGIRLLDHIIVGHDCHSSLLEMDLM
jgi:DNA repair proteins